MRTVGASHIRPPPRAKPIAGRRRVALFKYMGAKAWLTPLLIDVFRRLPVLRVVSGFAGSAVFEYGLADACPDLTVMAMDINVAIINCHQAFKATPVALEHAFVRLGNKSMSRADFSIMRKSFDKMTSPELPNVLAAAKFIQMMHHTFSGKYGSFISRPDWNAVANNHARFAHPSPPNLTFQLMDFFKFNDRDGNTKQSVPLTLTSAFLDFLRFMDGRRTSKSTSTSTSTDLPTAMYLDPPYLVDNPHYGRVNNLQFPHALLADKLREATAKATESGVFPIWIMSYNDCPEVINLYSKWCAIYRVPRVDPGDHVYTTITATELLILSRDANVHLRARLQGKWGCIRLHV